MSILQRLSTVIAEYDFDHALAELEPILKDE